MTDRSRTYDPTDWEIETFAPDEGTFVLGFSELGGTDVLGTTVGSYVTLDGLTNLTIRESSQTSQGIFFQITPATLSVTLSLKNFTRSDSYKFQLGSEITARFLNENNSNFPDKTIMFKGFIDSSEVSVSPGQDYATVSITATSERSKDLNNLYTITKDTTSLKSTLVSEAYRAGVVSTHHNPLYLSDSLYHYASTTTETNTFGEWLNDLVLSDQYLAFDSNIKRQGYVSGSVGSYTFVQDGRNSLVLQSPVVGTSVATLGSADINSLEIGWDGTDSPTGVELSLYEDDTITYAVSSGTIGANTVTATVDVKDLTELTSVGTSMLAVSKTLAPKMVTVMTGSKGQDIIFKEGTFTGSSSFIPVTEADWFYPKNVYQVGETLQINLPTQGFNNKKMLIVGRTIEVDQDNWLTSYDLWKGK